jgi:UDP-N-acetylglucosamine diphosphorylase / glucose-1-phosphate thymidylyltransferase / UDP-N-acetylgalactosamine diphosphorylase / glucosamine-1-phosphate N-acetyltransferase / galactosamine-1-phosphate N-acetyltransferase
MSALSKVIVLAAGRGTRMGELTGNLPKPMLPLAGKPMIEHILDRLRAAGVTEVLIVTGYRAETIEDHLRGYPLEITFIRQETINGTGTAALLGRDFAGADPALLTFGDIICDPDDYEGISARLRSSDRAGAALGVKRVDDPWQGAAVYEKDGIVWRIVEKPEKGTSATNWNSAGLYAFQPAIFDLLAELGPSPRGEYELTGAVAAMIQTARQVLLYEIKGGWRDVGRPEDLAMAEDIVG